MIKQRDNQSKKPMLKRTVQMLAMSVLMLQGSALLAQATAWFYGSIEEASRLAMEQGKEVLILFTCGEG